MTELLLAMLQGKALLLCAVAIAFLRPWLKYGILSPTNKSINFVARIYILLYEAVLALLIINGILFVLPVLALLALVLPGRRQFLHSAGRFLTTFYLKIIGVEVKLQGKENLPAGPIIMVQNIRSYLDGAATLATLPLTFRTIFKRTYVDYPLISWIASLPGDLTLEPEEISTMHDDILKILKVLSDGESVLAFAEEKLGGFEIHGSTALLALKSKLPVVPIRVFRKTTLPRVGAFFATPFPYEITIVIGQPLQMKELVDDKAARERVKAQVLHFLDKA